MKKTIISAAIIAAMGMSASAQSATLTSMSIADVDGDGIGGGFAFASGTSDPGQYTHFFDSVSSTVTTYGTFTTSGNGIITDGNEQSSANTDPANDSFTAGFIFNGYHFTPNSLVATGTGLDTIPGAGGVAGTAFDGDSATTFSEFNWSGTFGSEMFPLSPDAGFSTNTLTQGGSCSAAVGSNEACYVIRWEHFIQPQGGFSGDTVWQLEGIATFDTAINLGGGSPVPIPAAVWLFGSGLLGLAGVARRRRNS